MPNVILNGNPKKIMLNGVQYLGSSGGITPTLITKSITENGTYSAQDDNADGYSGVTVNVEPSSFELVSSFVEDNGTDASSFISRYETTQQVFAVPLIETQSLSGYVSYDSTTNEIIILKDFYGTLVGRVYPISNANSYHCGCLWLNDKRLLGYCYRAYSAHHAGMPYSLLLHEGDKIRLSSTNITEATDTGWNEPGYPTQQVKIYKGFPTTVAHQQEILDYVYYDSDSLGWIFGTTFNE